MSGLVLLVRRELGLALRGGTDAIMAVVFFVLAAILFPFGVGTDPAMLPRIGGGIIWVVATTRTAASTCSISRRWGWERWRWPRRWRIG